MSLGQEDFPIPILYRYQKTLIELSPTNTLIMKPKSHHPNAMPILLC